MQTTVVNSKLEKYDVYIGRGSKWGNPYPITRDLGRDECIAKYERYIRKRPDLIADLGELVGKRLGCFCKPARCHGDILVKLIEELNPEPKKAVTNKPDIFAMGIKELDRKIDSLEEQEQAQALSLLDRHQVYDTMDEDREDNAFIPSGQLEK